MAIDLEEQIKAASQMDDGSISNLLTTVKNTEIQVQELRKSAEAFDALFDAWDDAESYDETKVSLIFALAERDALDSASFRTALNEAVRFILPPYLASQTVLRAIGARDTDVQPHEIALRARKLQKVRNGALLNQQDSAAWGQINAIDRVTATFSVSSVSGNSVNSIPIEKAVVSANFFDPNPEMFNLLNPNKATLAAADVYRKAFRTHVLNDVSDIKIQDIIRTLLVPALFSAEAFELWWSAAPKATVPSGSRAVWEARSILELSTLLKPYSEIGGIELNEEQTARLAHIFTALRTPVQPKTLPMIADCIGILAEKNSDDTLRVLFGTLRGKLPFFPAVVNTEIPFAGLEIWGHVSAKLLASFVRVAKLLYTDDELAALWCRLPLRSMLAVFSSIEAKYIAAAVCKAKELSSDVLLFLWKNREALPKNLVGIVDMDHIANAISMEGLSKEWTAAERELKRALFEKDAFQKFVIANADDDIPSIVNALQKVRTFQSGECQSLMVKLARHSEGLKAHIESGQANKLFAEETKQTVQDVPISSRLSISRRAKELEKLINIDIPENRAAIAHARSLGDFRENAEYDAAKLRRRELNARRSSLEKDLGNVASTDFDKVEINGKVVLGSSVTLEDPSGKKTVCYILGAWDGDPDNNRYAYSTVIGKALVGQPVGAKVQLPEVGTRTITAIAPLPAEMQKELASEI